VKSIWWAREIHPLPRLPKKSNERQKRRWHEHPVWPRSSIKRKGIMASRMTLEHHQMSLEMGIQQGDTTRSSTHSVVLTESDSETSHD
jgi:hypothetical protein